MPCSVTVCGDPAASSAIETVAVKLAADAGVNVTEMEQLAFAASEFPQVFVCAKSAVFAPPSVMPLMFITALPVFFSVAVCAVAVVPVCVEKVSELGVTDATGTGTAVPVPLRATVCGEPEALSAIESVAAKLATEVGKNVTEIEQLVFTASELPQELVCAKSAAPVPPIVIPLMVSAALPVFLSVAV